MERHITVMLVAQNIEAAMKRKGTNAAEVARRAGLNPTGVYDIVSGKSRSPRLDTLIKIAGGLSMPLASLFIESSADDIDQDIMDAIRMLPAVERRRFLAMARAMLAPADTL